MAYAKIGSKAVISVQTHPTRLVMCYQELLRAPLALARSARCARRSLKGGDPIGSITQVCDLQALGSIWKPVLDVCVGNAAGDRTR